MSRNFGVSPCVLAGMLHASGDAVIYMDADLQDPPEVIPELIERWKSDPAIDVVHTVRRVRLGESRIKRLLTRIGYATLRAVASIELPNEAGDFKLLSRRAVDQVVRFREKRPFMRGLVCSIGFGQATVYYDRQPRGAGETKFPVLGWKVIRNFLDSAVISFSDLPLKVAGLLGAVFILASCVWIATLLASYSTGSDVAGWSAALAGTLFMGGLQLFSIGILGSYISGIYFETKGRPNFIVKETFGFAATDAPLEEPKRWTISDY
jgi:dolichol-phosphate mannosyltransferase